MGVLFKKRNCKIYDIKDLRILLTQISENTATLRLVDDTGDIIDYPRGFRVYDTLHKEYNQASNEVFIIHWNKSYVISINGIIKARIFNREQMKIFKSYNGRSLNPDNFYIPLMAL